MKRYIRAFAVSRSRLADDLDNHTSSVAHALAQLYLFPNSQYENHWRQEVWAGLHEVKKLKNNKYPSSKFIFENTWMLSSPHKHDFFIWAKYHESELSPIDNYSENEFNEIATCYFRWLAEKLSVQGFIPPVQVYQKLDELGL